MQESGNPALRHLMLSEMLLPIDAVEKSCPSKWDPFVT